jgi:hypothetical protein
MGNTPIEAVSQIVNLLAPLSPEDRRRAIRASLALLGDEGVIPGEKGGPEGGEQDQGEDNGLPPRARAWMKQNDVTIDEIQQTFHMGDGVAEVIASDIPGKNGKEKTLAAYILAGIAGLLATGNAAFDDNSARGVCRSSGCFNLANHAAYLKEKGNEFTGSKENGWTLTMPGLKRGAAIVKELGRPEK